MSKIVIHLIFIVSALACIIPLLLVVSISFTAEKSLMVDGYNFWPKVFDISAYRYVFSGAGSIANAYAVTIFVTVVGTLLHLLVTSMLSYSLTRPEVTYRNALTLFVYLPVLFNGGLVPSYILITRYLHLKNTIWVLIVVFLVSAINVLIMKNFFKSIPSSLFESARIDGSGEIRTFSVLHFHFQNRHWRLSVCSQRFPTGMTGRPLPCISKSRSCTHCNIYCNL